MILDRLELTNFKRFRHEEIEFHDGITGILGNNGTGKSSLVQAIFFALYGVQATGISADYIVSSFAGPKEKCTVVLDFRIGGDTYKVIRTFRKGKTVTHDAEFYAGCKLRAKGVSDVETEVKRTLGMGPVDFKNTIYAGQKDLLTLLENTPGKRREWFLRALGIDYLSAESQKILKEEIDGKTGELQRREGELAALSGRQSPEELAGLVDSVAKFRALIDEHGTIREARQKERAALDAQHRALAEQQLAYSRLLQQQQNLEKERNADTAQAEHLRAQIGQLADEEAEYHRIEKTAGSFEAVKQRLDTLRLKREEFLRLSAEHRHAGTQLAELALRAEKQLGLIKALEEDARKKAELVCVIRAGLGAGDLAEDRLESAVSYRLAEINRLHGTLSARLEQYRADREKIAADERTIREAGADGVCPLCRQKLGEHFADIGAEFSARLREIEEKAVADLERQEKLAGEKRAIEALKPSLAAVRSLDANLRQRPAYEAELAGLEEGRKQKAAELRALEEAIEQTGYSDSEYRATEQESIGLGHVQLRFIELGKKIGQGITARQHLEALTAKIAGRTAELERIGAEIAANAYDPAGAGKVEAAIAAAEAALRNEEVVIATATRDLRFTEEKIAEYRKAEAQIRNLQQQAGELKETIELLKLTRGLIAEYVVYLMQVVRSRLEGEVSRIIGEITGGRYEQVLLDEDFNLLIRDVDDDFPVDRFSGGEQDDIAVALRIALSRYLAELHNVHESTFLIFDEIFGSQDEERRNNLLRALRTQESRFPQILLISHIPEIQGEFANTLMVEMGAGTASRIRVVE